MASQARGSWFLSAQLEQSRELKGTGWPVSVTQKLCWVIRGWPSLVSSHARGSHHMLEACNGLAWIHTRVTYMQNPFKLLQNLAAPGAFSHPCPDFLFTREPAPGSVLHFLPPSVSSLTSTGCQTGMNLPLKSEPLRLPLKSAGAGKVLSPAVNHSLKPSESKQCQWPHSLRGALRSWHTGDGTGSLQS